MFGSKIILSSSDAALRKRLKNIFSKSGYAIVGESGEGITTLRMIRTMAPDLIVLDSEISGMSAMDLAKIVEEDRLAPIIIISSTWERNLAEKAKESWIFAFIVRPINEGNLLATAETAMMNFERMLQLEKEVNQLKDTIETRKIVERAKGLLMEKLSISESEAFKHMQHQSMDKCVPMKQVADAIILTYSISGKKK